MKIKIKIKMNKFFQIFLACHLLFLPLQTWAGDKVGNGGGIAEQNINYAYLKLQTILSLCLSSASCLNSKDQQMLVQKIITSLPKEYGNTTPFKFISGKTRPDIFLINGSYRTAVTGNNVGDLININTDLIYFDNEKYEREPLSIASAMGLLTHEFGHHHQELNHDYLDLIGAQVKAFALTSMDILKTDLFMDISDIRPPQLVMTGIHSKLISDSSLSGAESTLLFTDEKEVTNLSLWLDKTLITCQATQVFPAGKVLGFRLYNFRWGRWKMLEGSDSKRLYRIVADVSLFCEHREDMSYPVRFDNDNEIILELPVSMKFFPKESQRSWVLDSTSIKLKLLPIEN